MITAPTKNLLAQLRLGLAAALVTVLTGCASFNRIADFPTPAQPTTVAVVPKPMSKMTELPLGVFYDEQRNIIVTGHQKGLFAGMLFGVVGVLVTDQLNKSAGSSKYADDSAQSRQDLGSLLGEVLVAATDRGDAPNWTRVTDKAKLRLTPYAVFTVEKDGPARLYAMLRAEIPGPDGEPVWSARYFVRAPGLHPLDGNDTWMTGTRFTDGMRAALEKAVTVCIADTHGRWTAAKPTLAKGRFAYMNMEFEWPFLVVEEQADYVVGRLAAGDVMVMAGTHVLNRSDYTFKPGTFKDPRKK